MAPNAMVCSGDSPWALDSPNSPSFMECVVQGLEHSIDILSCDETTVRKVHDEFARVTSRQRPPDLATRDYAQLHDDFLESLLQEQAKLQLEAKLNQTPDELPSMISTSFSSTSSETGAKAASLDPPSKRRKPVKLRRRSPVKRTSPVRTKRAQIAPMMIDDQSSMSLRDDEDDSTAASLLSDFTKRSLPIPLTYVHAHCRLQKDKGKGEPVGSDICATGANPCLEKLRQKMELLTQVALGTNEQKPRKRGAASMKRRKAKVTEETGMYTETRSVIDLRMGFLSMQYGVLLRWDTANTGKIVMVVLRKTCHESFYNKEVVARGPTKRLTNKEPSPIVMSELNGSSTSHVILQRTDGTEVSLLEPPYRVDPPRDLTPSVVTLGVLQFDGLNERSTWTIHVCLDGVHHRNRYHFKDGRFVPIFHRAFEWEVPSNNVELSLQVSVYEQRRPRHKRRRLVCRETVHLNLLDSGRVAHNQQVAVQCRNQGLIIFNILHQSDYAHWLHQELEARRREESGGFQWRAPFYPIYVDEGSTTVSEDSWWCCAW